MRILLIDNYDSFTYNILHLLRKIAIGEVIVCKNDEISLDEVALYDKIILSPGPGIPQEAGLLLDIIRRYASSKAILGICLGHQAIAEAFGGELVNLPEVYHGISSLATQVAEHHIFDGLPNTIEVGRYHSWAVVTESLPNCFRPTMLTDDGCLMAFAHNQFDIHGVQFHPESVLTPFGENILRNFLQPQSREKA